MKTAALKVTTPSERELVMTREFDAPRGMVFDALTKPELVQRWLLGPPGWTMPVCEIDLRVGGKYRRDARHHGARRDARQDDCQHDGPLRDARSTGRRPQDGRDERVGGELRPTG